MSTCYQAKDFIQTQEGLIFAVVEAGLEEGKVLCFLRYVLQAEVWKKLSTDQANQLLQADYPQYLFYSTVKSASLHAVSVADINIHYQPKQQLQLILTKPKPDKIEQDLIDLCQLFKSQGVQIDELGVTGSLLIGAQNAHSDIDIIIYNRDIFHQIRRIIKHFVTEGVLQQLHDKAWLASYQRRLCDLSYADYVWHEQRKYNKALVHDRKFDLNLVELPEDQTRLRYQKQGVQVIQALVLDNHYAFDYPARFIIAHDQVDEVVCYTATYTGQAEQGEIIEASGQLEIASTGKVRLLVGSTREAQGEYIKVVTAI